MQTVFEDDAIPRFLLHYAGSFVKDFGVRFSTSDVFRRNDPAEKSFQIMLFESQENVVSLRGGSNYAWNPFFFKIEKKRFDSGDDGNALLARDGSIDALLSGAPSLNGGGILRPLENFGYDHLVSFSKTEGKVFRGQWEVVFPSKDFKLSS